jgi:malate dehydrogenase
MRKKITVVGAGRVGETTAHILAERALGDLVLVDVVDKLAEGKALDLMELRPLAGVDVSIVGTTGYEATADSDVVVVTSGMPRKPGESREDLLKKNIAIVKAVVGEVKKTSPRAILVMVANPLDTMTWVARELTGWPRNRVFGMAGVLDTARLRTFVAMELGCSVRDVNAFVLGGHGDEMVPVVRYASVGGIPLERLLSKEKIDAIVNRTRSAGGEK